MNKIPFVGKKSGTRLIRFEMTEAEYHEFEDECSGLCVRCGEIRDGHTEPDARQYHCDDCGENRVYGVPELLVMNFVAIV